ncbi:MAG: FIG00460331: hypothetical protein [uncultured Paraburkholderia sp.]|nr:MAG: FIG00460331: hypothetical protein [uncultured Paraburkholderia sp.]CAH2924446.1 MAG: FIG00460331: hypothetical protein [uncultured Paraburkholderia sp.]
MTGRVNSQLASRNLDASEKLAAGGPDAVRAYRADEVPSTRASSSTPACISAFPLRRATSFNWACSPTSLWAA